MKQKRISAALSSSGIASRRACEKIVLEGRVKINNKLVKDLSFKVSPYDKIELDGKPVKLFAEKIAIAMNKPAGYICSVKDNFKRKTVMELVKNSENRLYPAGRLDADSRGLLILTNDGELAFNITHPSLKIPKTYIAAISKGIKKNDFEKLAGGFEIEGRLFAPVELSIPSAGELGEYNIVNYSKEAGNALKITISEGRKRIIRKAFLSLGYKVIDLKRIKIGKYKLGNIPEGSYRVLNSKEIDLLLNK